MSGLSTLDENVEHFRIRVLQDALTEATAAYWTRRAETFEAARPVPGEFHGRATREALSAQWRRLTEMAAACRAKAQIAPLDLILDDVDAVLGEVA